MSGFDSQRMNTFLTITLLLCSVAAAFWIGGKSRQPRTITREPPTNARPLFHIRYRDDNGAEARRDIFPLRSTATEEGFEAWCYLREDERRFQFKQITAVRDNNLQADIGVRGLRSWFGLPDTEATFLDELPDALKQSPWPESPQKARFRITTKARGAAPRTIECAPVRWGSHRRTMSAHVWPSHEIEGIDFADVDNAIDLETGEVLSRVDLWRSVLSHRHQEDVPWYVRLADARALSHAIILISREATGRFLAKDLPHLNAALAATGAPTLTPTELAELASNAARSGDEGRTISAKDAVAQLSEHEKQAAAQAINEMATAKKPEVAQRLSTLAAQLIPTATTAH